MSGSYRQRVAYAEAAFLRNEDSRAFDNCFEMYDGAAVVVALMRRARTNPLLLDAIKAQFSAHGIGHWEEIERQYARIPDARLSKLSRELIAAAGARDQPDMLAITTSP